MNHHLTSLLIAFAALGAGCGDTAPRSPLLDRALDALGGREALTSVTSVYLLLEGELIPPGDSPEKIPYRAEHRLLLPDSMAIRVQVAGLTTWRSVTGEKAWTRAGAAVADLAGREAEEERADRDDYLALLLLPALRRGFRIEEASEPNRVRLLAPDGRARLVEFDPGSGLPVRIERLAIGGGSENARLVRTFLDYRPCGGILLPRRIRVDLAGGRLDLEVTRAEVNGDADHGLTLERPRDRGEPRTEGIRRERERRADYISTTHRGRLTDLARVDLLLERALRQSRARKRGPIRRIFRELPDGSGVALVETRIPVSLSHEPEAGNLPRGVGVVSLRARDVLAMAFTGPYPRDRKLEEILAAYGEDLGLEPAGPATYLVLSPPDVGGPADLRQEVRLPVRPAK